LSLPKKNVQQWVKASERLVIIFDDNTKIGYLMGLGSRVTADHVNFMIKYGKGLVYVCITDEMAKQLELPPMVNQDFSCSEKYFSVSVDFKTTSTGISAVERADTIRAFVNLRTQPHDFKRPGHIIPLISRKQKMMENPGITEAAVFLADWISKEPVAYLCEVLNADGDIASLDDVKKMGGTHGLQVLTLSEIRDFQLRQMKWFDVIEKKEATISGQAIDVFQMKNKLDQSLYTIYLKSNRSRVRLIEIYEECPWGDRLDVNQYCACKKHFKQYFDEFLHNRVDGLIYHRENQMKPLTVNEKSAILAQLKEWVLWFGNQSQNINRVLGMASSSA
jgi:3,4-dihydroxy 2-butanone 4-phosphate synthase/GTP cyclohydrolase II